MKLFLNIIAVTWGFPPLVFMYLFMYLLPKKLRRNNYSSNSWSKETFVNDTVGRMKTELDQKIQNHVPDNKSNLTTDEAKGFKADKGGAILIVYPDLLRKKHWRRFWILPFMKK